VFGSGAAAGVHAQVDWCPPSKATSWALKLQLLRSHAKRSMYTYFRHLPFPISSLGDRLVYHLIHFGSGVLFWRKGAAIQF